HRRGRPGPHRRAGHRESSGGARRSGAAARALRRRPRQPARGARRQLEAHPGRAGGGAGAHRLRLGERHPRPGGRRRRGALMFRIIVIYLVLLLHVLDTSVANLALVRIARDLQIEIFQSQWIVTSFGVGVGIAISLAGRLSAWAGERTVLTLALVG